MYENTGYDKNEGRVFYLATEQKQKKQQENLKTCKSRIKRCLNISVIYAIG